MSYVLSFIYIGIYWNKLQYRCHPSPVFIDDLFENVPNTLPGQFLTLSAT
jgi:hypothetical protein